jgi:hypothetical protein
VRYARFNVEAAAEWTWNVDGRTPHEFALSWAVREGLADPEKFAEWSNLLGPVAWDVYGSEWPAGERRNHPGPVAEALRKGNLPELGDVLWGVYPAPWGDFKSPQQLDDDVAAAAQAVQWAREMGLPEFLQESLIVQGYVNALKSLWELKQLIGPAGLAPENREKARRYFQMYLDALRQSAQALPEWEAAAAPGSDARGSVQKPVETIQGMIEQMKATAGELGFM